MVMALARQPRDYALGPPAPTHGEGTTQAAAPTHAPVPTIAAVPTIAPVPTIAKGSAAMSRFRLNLACSTQDLRTHSVHVTFDHAAQAALVAIGDHADVVLQLLGVDAAGNLVARYLRVTARPRQAVAVGPDSPDLLAALVAVQALPPQPITCLSTDVPHLVQPSTVESAAVALAIDASAAASGDGAAGPAWALAHCRDRRGVAVPLLLYAPASRAETLL